MKTIYSLLVICLFASMAAMAQVGYKVGDYATDFSLKNVDGKFVSMKDYKDAKGIILIFTCNHCPFSIAYEDRIKALHYAYVRRGYPVVAVNSNDAVAYPADSYENMKERATDERFPFAYVYDESQAFAKTYGATKTPHVFILKKVDDKFKVVYIGAIDDNSNEPELVKTKYAENALRELIEGKEITQNMTKAVGCSIKWKK